MQVRINDAALVRKLKLHAINTSQSVPSAVAALLAKALKK